MWVKLEFIHVTVEAVSMTSVSEGGGEKWKWRVDRLKEEGRSGGSEARATKNISRSGISLWCAVVRSAALLLCGALLSCLAGPPQQKRRSLLVLHGPHAT